MDSSDISICADRLILASGEPAVALKIQMSVFELNIWIPECEISLLGEVRSARWDSRSSQRIGCSAGAAVFWSFGDDGHAISVGEDDETWDFGVTLPHSALDEILTAVKADKPLHATRVS